MTPLLSTLVLIAATASPAPTRLEQLVEANVLGTHAFQVALSKKEGKGDPACYRRARSRTRSSRRSRRARPHS